ncbi:MAG: ROK family protein [Flavipsychrobacter sp.]|nr:ROK family protein [Flavipsychrobacter sp.]
MQKWAIGVDLGGTKIEIAIVSTNGRVLDRLRIPTESTESPEQIIDKISENIEKLVDKHLDIPLETIGIGVAGQIQKNTGIIKYAPNLNWHNVDLQSLLSKKLGKTITVCNDVKAAAWGEWFYGAGVGFDDMVCIFVGTGIGGAIISDGKMIDGCNNTAGEVGHMTVQLHGPVCHCGNYGCLEALAGGWAISRDAQQAVQSDTKGGSMLLELAGGDINAIDGKTVAAALGKGDSMARGLVDNVTDALIAGVTTIINMVGPCRIVLGGGVIEGIPELVDRVEAGVKKYALKAAIDLVKIVPAQLHNDSGVVGAAAFALHKLTKDTL